MARVTNRLSLWYRFSIFFLVLIYIKLSTSSPLQQNVISSPNIFSKNVDSLIENYNARQKGDLKLLRKNLTTEEKCKLDGYEGPLSCVLEYDYPEIAKKLYKILQPTFTSPDPYFFDRAMKQASREQDSIIEPARGTNARNYNENLAMKEDLNFIEQRNFSEQLFTNKRTKRTTASNNEVAVCPTLFEIRTFSQVTHFRTRRLVPLYATIDNWNPYPQYFQEGRCRETNPLSTLINNDFEVNCRQTEARVLATITVSTDLYDQFPNDFERCNLSRDSRIYICYDWILVKSHCKLFLTTAKK